jgi:hypothetical protein
MADDAPAFTSPPITDENLQKYGDHPSYDVRLKAMTGPLAKYTGAVVTPVSLGNGTYSVCLGSDGLVLHSHHLEITEIEQINENFQNSGGNKKVRKSKKSIVPKFLQQWNEKKAQLKRERAAPAVSFTSGNNRHCAKLAVDSVRSQLRALLAKPENVGQSAEAMFQKVSLPPVSEPPAALGPQSRPRVFPCVITQLPANHALRPPPNLLALCIGTLPPG